MSKGELDDDKAEEALITFVFFGEGSGVGTASKKEESMSSNKPSMKEASSSKEGFFRAADMARMKERGETTAPWICIRGAQ